MISRFNSPAPGGGPGFPFRPFFGVLKDSVQEITVLCIMSGFTISEINLDK